MALGGLKTEADLSRWLEREFHNRFGAISFQQISGTLDGSRISPPLRLDEVAADPDAPSEGAYLYCIADNGAGKREIRARFPTGAVQVVKTEP